MAERPLKGLAWCLGVGLLAGMGGAHAAEVPRVPPAQMVAGLSQRTWAERWQRWINRYDWENSPAADPTGEKCALGQQGPVWFLSGSVQPGPVVRTCRVPAGRHLMVPLYPLVGTPQPHEPVPGCARMRRQLEALGDQVSGLTLVLDGVPMDGLDRHRLRPLRCFDLGSQWRPPTRIHPSAVDGHYVMLKPLSPGAHTLQFTGQSPKRRVDITYMLQVD